MKPLTTRQAQIARMVLRGSHLDVVADTLHLSPSTVKSAMRVVRKKAGVKTTVQLATTELARTLLQ